MNTKNRTRLEAVHAKRRGNQRDTKTGVGCGECGKEGMQTNQDMLKQVWHLGVKRKPFKSTQTF